MTDIRIVCADRGWTLVGHYRREGEEVVLSRYAVLRSWSHPEAGLMGVAVDPAACVLDRAAPDAEWRAHMLIVVGGTHQCGPAWDEALS